jgi:hypothetical protein
VPETLPRRLRGGFPADGYALYAWRLVKNAVIQQMAESFFNFSLAFVLSSILS